MSNPVIAIAGLIHETNTFSRHLTSLNDFIKGTPNPPIVRGEAFWSELQNLNIPISGAIDTLQSSDVTVMPILWAEAGPGGLVEDLAFETLAQEIIDGLTRLNRIDGIFLDLHGAMVTESLQDAEGELLRRVRQLVGPEVPIAIALDLHANMSDEMLDHSDFAFACREYPHLDFFETGQTVACALLNMINTGIRYSKRLERIDCLLPMAMQSTMLEAPRQIYRRLQEIDQSLETISSFCMGFPLSDIRDVGPSFVCYGYSSTATLAAMKRLRLAFDEHKDGFRLQGGEGTQVVRDAVERAKQSDRPVIIADVADNSGGGASSDSTGLLSALVHGRAENAILGLMYDPEAAALAHRAGTGAELEVSLGGRRGLQTDQPFEGKFRVEHLSDGELVCTGEFFKNINPRLGPTCVLRVLERDCDVRVIVTSARCQLADLEMMRAVGIEPTSCGIIVVKSTAHFRADFEPIAEAVLIGLSPGELVADPADIDYRNIRAGVELGVGGAISN